jgi:peptidyl-prolyl cis-trans isomerase D
VLIAASACGAIKDAMTSHVDVVARAGSQELTVTELADMMANSQVPLRPDVARTIAQMWVNYQLLGLAASKGDTLGTIELANQGMWSTIEQMRLTSMYEQYAKAAATVDTSKFRAAYEAGELLGAAHILISKQPEGLGTAANDSLRREAEAIARTVTSATFARVARARSQDPGSKDRGGDYGVFPPGTMVPEFDAGILSVKPGEITGVVETQFGYHVIRRSTWDEIKDQFASQYANRLAQKAESTFFASAEEGMNIKVKDNAPRLVKAMAEDIDGYRDDRTTIATSRVVDLTAARMSQWMAAFPPASQIRAQLMDAPDSLIPQFVMNIMRNEILLKRADSLGIQPDSATMVEARNAFWGAVSSSMNALQIAPAQLGTDTTDSEAAREALAATRANDYLRKLVRSEVGFVEIPEQIALVLRDRYESRVVPAGLDRAVAEATRLRTVKDSTAAATQPPSAVPMPSAPAPAPTPNP